MWDPDDILKVAASAIEKILERAAKGKRIGSQDLSFLLLYDMSSRIGHMDGEMAGVRQEMSAFRQEFRQEVTGFRQDMSNRMDYLNGEIAGLRSEAAGFRQDMKPLIEAVAELIKRSKQPL